MKQFIISALFAMILIPVGGAAMAVGVGGTCVNSEGSSGCDAKLYCKQISAGIYECISCSFATSNTHPESPADSANINKCFKTCVGEVKPGFANGTWAADGSAVYNNPCTFTNPANITCYATAHQVGNTCVSNTRPCTIANGVGEQTWINNSLWSECKVVSCNAGYHPNVANTACESNTRPCAVPIANGVGQETWITGILWTGCKVVSCNGGYHPNPANTACDPDNMNCNTAGLTAADPTAAMTWDTGTGTWRKTECWRINTNQAIVNGTCTEKCFYTSGAGTAVSDFATCTITSLTACSPGFYNESGFTCVATKSGWYSDTNALTARKCPGGMTGPGGSNHPTKCYYKGGASGTRFCDKNGCFFLPADVKF